MDIKRLATRNILQKVFNLTPSSNEQQLSSGLTVPLLNKNERSSTSTVPEVAIINPSPVAATYALGPTKKFDFSRAQKLLQLELTRRCAKISRNVRYDPKLSSDLAGDLAQQLRRVVKADNLNYARYKIVVLISIIQTAPNRQIHQSVALVSRCLWNRDTDGSVTAQTKLGYDMVAIATAFAVYTD
ncbi:unnamed protein product [Rotaria sp. Silwood2]|nr:unnamed protein product [Rotaria sp. Silwood2]CAF2581952.1 unnamed protein product [Rotaria sp. Silwood2]CAF2841130.1 unnamed protein product [Rotaria sp. Silwood2]CAF2989847.1 unnamed protein product [Rotaria sp. Silwood2]CAF3994926.1 unnamed protein product [Rotaria sp. Silwood2]